MAAAPAAAGNGLSSSRGVPRSRGLDEGVIKVVASPGRAKGARAVCSAGAGARQRRGGVQGGLEAGRSAAAASAGPEAGADAASARGGAGGRDLTKASTLPPSLA